MNDTTIAAVSTPHGAGGVAMIRLSGPRSHAIADRIFFAKSGRAVSALEGYRGALGEIRDGGTVLDEAIAYIYHAPRSYTGEDVAELTLHGGLWLAQRVLRLCLASGASPAEPGEFTKRAFLNGKMDLSRAEAVMNVISAQSELALRAAVGAYEGNVSTAVGSLVEKLLAQASHLAAWSDYPDEGILGVDADELLDALDEISRGLERLLATYDHGRILREGVKTAIVGKPNVGKSTLMNLLSGYERSIVTNIPGTTRDVVTESVRVGEFVLQLYDTAGIRETDDPVERVGVERARLQIERAELVLAVFDSAAPLDDRDLALFSLLDGKRTVALLNKTDLPSAIREREVLSRFPHVVFLSAERGEGYDELCAAIRDVLGMQDFGDAEAVIASERQHGHLARARDAVSQAGEALRDGNTFDAVGVCIDEALGELLSLTGERADQRIIDEVFSRFCVGK